MGGSCWGTTDQEFHMTTTDEQERDAFEMYLGNKDGCNYLTTVAEDGYINIAVLFSDQTTYKVIIMTTDL